MNSFEIKKISERAIFLIAAFLCMFHFVGAQSSSNCPNSDFSDGFTGWRTFLGTTYSWNTSNNNFPNDLDPVTGVRYTASYLCAQTYDTCIIWMESNPTAGRHEILINNYNNTLIDENTCNGPANRPYLYCLHPDLSLNSLKLGSYGNSRAQAASYRITIDSSNALVILHFAVVMYDQGHGQNEQPKFTMRVLDTNGNLLNISRACSYYPVAAAASIPGFINCDRYRWRDWTSVGISLLDLVGETVDIRFATMDCGQGGFHPGYAYLAIECSSMVAEAIYCDGDNYAKLNAPGKNGTFTSYQWYKNGSPLPGETNWEYILNNPNDKDEYKVSVTSAIGCQSDLIAVIKKISIATDFEYYIDTCGGANNETKIRLIDKAYARNGPIKVQEFIIERVLGGTELHSIDSIVEHTFNDTGWYRIIHRVTVETPTKDCIKSDTIDVYVFPTPDISIDVPHTFCRFQEQEMVARCKNYKEVDYQWSNNILYKISDTVAIIDRAGEYKLTAISPQGCKAYYSVMVTDVSFELNVITQDVPCYNDSSGIIEIDLVGEYNRGYTFPYWEDLGGFAAGYDAVSVKQVNLKAKAYVIYSYDEMAGCFRYDTIRIYQPDPIVSYLEDSKNVMCKQPGFIEISALGGTPPYTYVWTDAGGDTIGNETRVNLPLAGTYNIRITDANDCILDTSFSIKEIFRPTISIASFVNERCTSSNGAVETMVVTEFPESSLTYDWYKEDELIEENSTDVIKNNLAAGKYTIIVQADRQIGCWDTAEVNLGNHPIPEILLDVVSPEYCDRKDGYIEISVVAHKTDSIDYNDSIEYWWEPTGDSTQRIENLETGSYAVTITDKMCKNTASYTVHYVEGPIADYVTDNFNARVNKSFILNDNSASGGGTGKEKGGLVIDWSWYYEEDSLGYGRTLQYAFSETGDYPITLIIIDSNGCIDSVTKNVHIYEDLIVYIPNVFAPDGKNSTWGPVMTEYSKDGYLLEIFDRWGERIFKTNDTEERWDGMIEGYPVTSTNVYSYRLIVYDFLGQEYEFVGHVTLLR